MNQLLQAPFPWFGGKRKVAAEVWARFGADVHNYVEPFAGSLAVLLNRPGKARVETVNDKDRYLCNAWRAIQFAPDEVAHWADWPVNECDLHARHKWLVVKGPGRLAQLEDDPDFYDAKIAGWWLWGIGMWIGGGWCRQMERRRPGLKNDNGIHVHRKRPVVEERGVHISRRLPHLKDGGKGVNRASLKQQKPYLGNGGLGVHRQIPALNANRSDKSLNLVEYMEALAERLRRVRVVCGDWGRVLTPSVTFKVGTTAIFLDPPYASEANRDDDLYNHDDLQIAHQVREWCLEEMEEKVGSEVIWKGPRYLHPRLRIALCGYEQEHGPHMPADWECVAWKANGGYGNQNGKVKNGNALLERIWFSPNCLKVVDSQQKALFSF